MTPAWRVVIAAAVAVAVVALNFTRHVDADAGGYRPQWRNRASYPKAYVHGVSGFAAALAVAVFTGQPAAALLIVAAGAVLWEFSQGFVNLLDIAAGVGGALAACVLYAATH